MKSRDNRDFFLMPSSEKASRKEMIINLFLGLKVKKSCECLTIRILRCSQLFLFPT